MNIVAHSRQPQWQDEGWAIHAQIYELADLFYDFPSPWPDQIDWAWCIVQMGTA